MLGSLHGANDTLLHANILQRRLTPETLPVLPNCIRRCRNGLRLDCVLAHLEDAHAWTSAELASLGAEQLGARRDGGGLHDLRIVAPILAAVERLEGRLLHGRPRRLRLSGITSSSYP